MTIEESLNKQPSHDHFVMRETNKMEMDLMRRSALGREEWIKRYGKKFREIVEDSALKIILLGLYDQDPKLAEDYIEQKLREQEPDSENQS